MTNFLEFNERWSLFQMTHKKLEPLILKTHSTQIEPLMKGAYASPSYHFFMFLLFFSFNLKSFRKNSFTKK
jgi:hypothetical protein